MLRIWTLFRSNLLLLLCLCSASSPFTLRFVVPPFSLWIGTAAFTLKFELLWWNQKACSLEKSFTVVMRVIGKYGGRFAFVVVLVRRIRLSWKRHWSRNLRFSLWLFVWTDLSFGRKKGYGFCVWLLMNVVGIYSWGCDWWFDDVWFEDLKVVC